jgi:hypothetical protein
VIGQGTRLTAAIVAAVLMAGLFVACGGSDSTSTATEENPAVTALQVSGGGSEQFRVKGSASSSLEFGEEGDDSELQAAAEVVHGFYAARVEGEPATACSYMAKALVEKLEKLAARSTSTKGCVPFLEAFTSEISAPEGREMTTVDAGSLRQDGEQAFLIYYGAGDAAYAMPLRQEDDAWKVASLSGEALG